MDSKKKYRLQHIERVRAQYESINGTGFYKWIMGDGGCDIHYGIYESPFDSISAASRRSTSTLLGLTAKYSKLGLKGKLLDLGSGNGGPAHQILLETNLHITCLNLCELQNEQNLRRAKEIEVLDRLSIQTGSFESLPTEWSSVFDIVWSQESLCHAIDKKRVLSEARRVIRDGGLIAFSDIMISNNVSLGEAKSFTDRNAISRLATPADYEYWLESVGFKLLHQANWSHHLQINFAHMLNQIQIYRPSLLEQGIESEYLDTFAKSLQNRIERVCDGVFYWGAFIGSVA